MLTVYYNLTGANEDTVHRGDELRELDFPYTATYIRCGKYIPYRLWFFFK